MIVSGIVSALGQNVAPPVVKDFKEDEEAFDKEQKMVVDLVGEVRHNLEIVIMVPARVSNLLYIQIKLII